MPAGFDSHLELLVITASQIVVASIIVFVLPVADLVVLRGIKRETSTRRRLRFYCSVLIYAWTASIAAAATFGGHWVTILRSPQPAWAKPGLTSGAVALVVLAYLFLSFRAGYKSARSQRVRDKLWSAFRHVRFFLPVSRTERRWFVALSITAGLCEEFLYRGFLMHLLYSRLRLPLTLAFVLTALAFGFAHIYQGIRGFISTFVAGALFGVLALLSGSLWLPMLIHALLDLQILLMYQPLRDKPDVAARLIAGADPLTA